MKQDYIYLFGHCIQINVCVAYIMFKYIVFKKTRANIRTRTRDMIAFFLLRHHIQNVGR